MPRHNGRPCRNDMAVYGPYDFTYYTDLPNGSSILVRRLSTYRQSLPHVVPTAHHSGFVIPEKSLTGYDWIRDNHVICSPKQGVGSYRCAFNRPDSWPPGQARDMADRTYAGAYDGFVKELGAKADLAVTLAEASEAWELIAARATQLTKLIRAWRGRQWDDFFAAAGGFEVVSRWAKPQRYTRGWFRSRDRSRTIAKRRKVVKTTLEKRWRDDAANGWLEVNLGWLPMIQDIGNAVEVLQAPQPNLWARATAKGFLDVQDRVSIGEDDWANYWGTINLTYLIGGELRVVSPNLLLANQLGFVNPASVAWSLVPGSFLFDWIIPVGRFVSSWTDLYGFDLRRTYVSSLCNFSFGHTNTYQPQNTVVMRRALDGYGFFRDLNISVPSLMSRSVFSGSHGKLQSWWKGLTAFSLLHSVMLSKK